MFFVKRLQLEMTTGTSQRVLIIDNFFMPNSTMSASSYRDRIDWLMGKYQHYYTVEIETSKVFAQQRDKLLNVTVTESEPHKSGAEVYAFNKEKVFILLKTFKTDAFKQHISRFIRYVESKVCKKRVF